MSSCPIFTGLIRATVEYIKNNYTKLAVYWMEIRNPDGSLKTRRIFDWWELFVPQNEAFCKDSKNNMWLDAGQSYRLPTLADEHRILDILFRQASITAAR